MAVNWRLWPIGACHTSGQFIGEVNCENIDGGETASLYPASRLMRGARGSVAIGEKYAVFGMFSLQTSSPRCLKL